MDESLSSWSGRFPALFFWSSLAALSGCSLHDKGGNPSSAPAGETTSQYDLSQKTASRAVNVTTYHNDLSRTGQNLDETKLTPANVIPATFGKIGAMPVDGLVYAQPLYVQNLTISGAVHNVLFVATEHDSVYAFDADSLSATPLWHRNFAGDSVLSCLECSSVPTADVSAPNISPEIGITSTPVIDLASKTLYVLAMTKEVGDYYHRLHAIDITTGVERPNSPVEITAELPGTGYGSLNGMTQFYPLRQLSRQGLAFYDGALYFGFSSFNDQEPAHGWFFSYEAKTLKQRGVYLTSPASGDANIWGAGHAPAIDSQGHIFVTTGNDDSNDPTMGDRGNTVLRFNANLKLTDWFTPFNTLALSAADVDLGSGGILLLPDQPGRFPHLAVAGGKEGVIHVLDRDNLGKILGNPTAASNTNIVQDIRGIIPGDTNASGIYGTMSYFNGAVYVAAWADYLRSFPLTKGKLDVTKMTHSSEQIALRGATLSVSANGEKNGILWLINPSAYSYSYTGVTVTDGPAILMAYDASDISNAIYRSDIAPSDVAGFPVKFAVPTVANGRVYIGTQTEVDVYGNVPPRQVPPFNPFGAYPERLSETGLFTDLKNMTPSAGLIPYDVISPLWSDNAIKTRWLNLPAGAQITFSARENWQFPQGTRFIKNFNLDLGEGTIQRLETRILTSTKSGWQGVTYQWNAAQTDALLLTNGGTQSFTIHDPSVAGGIRTQIWNYPSSAQCLQCHTPAAGGALGVRTLQLNHNFANGNGTSNQLDYLNRLNLFTQSIGSSSQYDTMAYVGDTTATLEKRARSYFASNCAQCHQPDSNAPVDIDFRYDTPDGAMNLLGVVPTKGNLGVTGADLITPGNHATSVVYLRMDTVGIGRMPPLSTVLIDQTAVPVIASWIDGLSAAQGSLTESQSARRALYKRPASEGRSPASVQMRKGPKYIVPKPSIKKPGSSTSHS